MAKRIQTSKKRKAARQIANKKQQSFQVWQSPEGQAIKRAFPDPEERQAYITALLREFEDVN